MSAATSFFVAGGTLPNYIPSYVYRDADEELFKLARSGEFCYILTSRQMGKSSLMVKTLHRLQEVGKTPISIDLTEIGEVSVDAWYLGLLSIVADTLDLEPDVEQWWWDHAHLGPSQRFITFLRDIALGETDDDLVIFIDEIDSTLKLDFRDDFFVALRAMYNARANDKGYKRLTFVLLGVATPTDLIQDRDRTPFNIGHRIPLQEFRPQEAGVFIEGLEQHCDGQADMVFNRVLHWSHGHPYLTQKLCASIAEQSHGQPWNDEQVDALVEHTFLSEQGQKDTNFKSIQWAIESSKEAERQQMLKLYQNVYQGKGVASDDRSLEQNYLELFGLVRRTEGKLVVRNEIYRHIFNEGWIEANLPEKKDRRLAIGATVVAFVSIVLLAFFLPNLLKDPQDAQADAFAQTFQEAATGAERFDALYNLFVLGDDPENATNQDRKYDVRARLLFFGMSADEQKQMFLEVGQVPPEQVVTVVQGIAPAFVGDGEGAVGVIEAMQGAIDTTQSEAASHLHTQLQHWRDGLVATGEGRDNEAIAAYTEAITEARVAGDDNAALHFERARVYLKDTATYTEALLDLDTAVSLVNERQSDIQLDDLNLDSMEKTTLEENPFILASEVAVAVRSTIIEDDNMLWVLFHQQTDRYSSLASIEGFVSDLDETATAQTAVAMQKAQTATAQAIAGIETMVEPGTGNPETRFTFSMQGLPEDEAFTFTVMGPKEKALDSGSSNARNGEVSWTWDAPADTVEGRYTATAEGKKTGAINFEFTIEALPTPTNTPVPPTNTPTNTPVPSPPTNTPTNTPVPSPPTNTPTNTPVPPSPTATPTLPPPPTATPTLPPPPTATPTLVPPVAEPNVGTPEGSVSPTSDDVTTSFVFTVSGFTHDDRISYWVERSDGRTRCQGCSHALENGGKTFDWRPEEDAPEGAYMMVVQGQTSQLMVRIPFGVNAPPPAEVPQSQPIVPSCQLSVAPNPDSAMTFDFHVTGFHESEQVIYWVTDASNNVMTEGSFVPRSGEHWWSWTYPSGTPAGTYTMVAKSVERAVNIQCAVQFAISAP